MDEINKPKKNIMLIISTVLAILWTVFIASTYFTLPGDATGDAEVLGTAIAMSILLPAIIVSVLGCLFNVIGFALKSRGFILTGQILYCVALLLGITYTFGYIPSIVLGFIGFSKMPKKIKM